eukprot:1865846-Rhodomonas_salina.1
MHVRFDLCDQTVCSKLLQGSFIDSLTNKGRHDTEHGHLQARPSCHGAFLFFRLFTSLWGICFVSVGNFIGSMNSQLYLRIETMKIQILYTALDLWVGTGNA